jgi:hypothetical protein
MLRRVRAVCRAFVFWRLEQRGQKGKFWVGAKFAFLHNPHQNFAKRKPIFQGAKSIFI